MNGEKYTVKLSIFTPAYNRAHTLPRLYDSLCRQKSYDFEWIIVDDGSQDNTYELAGKWQAEAGKFKISYFYKENGGLASAYNEAIAHLGGELAVCIDSDDYVPDNFTELIINFWAENGSEKYAGIAGLDYNFNGKLCGKPFPDVKEINPRWKSALVKGDKKYVVRSILYKNLAPMKIFEGEKYGHPHYFHLEIGKTHNFLVLNENLVFIEYQPDGMSNSIWWQYYQSPNSYRIQRIQEFGLNLGFRRDCVVAIHYISSCILSRRFRQGLKESPKKLITVLMIPFGIIFSLIVRLKKRSRGKRKA